MIKFIVEMYLSSTSFSSSDKQLKAAIKLVRKEDEILCNIHFIAFAEMKKDLMTKKSAIRFDIHIPGCEHVCEKGIKRLLAYNWTL